MSGLKIVQNLILCLVIAVSDGDTIKARCGNDGAYQQVKVRLSEIDAPEKKQPFGERSKQSLSELCFNKQATIKPMTTDRYGRTVARVTCEGVDANREQVQRGMAWVYDKYVTDKSLFAVQDSVKQAGRGLWADPLPIPPWHWRKERKGVHG